MGKRTRELVPRLDAATLGEPLDAASVDAEVRAEERYPSAVAERVAGFFGAMTHGDLLGHQGLVHSYDHWGQVQVVAALAREGRPTAQP